MKTLANHPAELPASVSNLFMYLLENGPASRIEASREIGVTRPTISEAAERLLELGYVRVLDKEAGATGRRGRIPEIYEVPQDFGSLLTFIDCGATLELRAYDVRMNLLAEASSTLNWEDATDVRQSVQKLVDEVKPQLVGPILSTAISTLLPVNPQTQQVVLYEDRDSETEVVDLYGIIKDLVGIPVMLDNHVNWSLFGEARSGAGVGMKNLLTFSFGEDIGAALSRNGVLDRGSQGRAGELSRITIGGHHLKDYINNVAVHSGEKGVAGFDYVEVAPTARKIAESQGDPDVDAYLAAFGELGANLLMVLDSDALILTGPMVDYAGFSDRITKAVKDRMLWDIPVKVAEDGARSTERGVLVGAQRLGLSYLGIGSFE